MNSKPDSDDFLDSISFDIGAASNVFDAPRDLTFQHVERIADRARFVEQLAFFRRQAVGVLDQPGHFPFEDEFAIQQFELLGAVLGLKPNERRACRGAGGLKQACGSCDEGLFGKRQPVHHAIRSLGDFKLAAEFGAARGRGGMEFQICENGTSMHGSLRQCTGLYAEGVTETSPGQARFERRPGDDGDRAMHPERQRR